MTLPAPEEQRCWFGWLRAATRPHVHRCGGKIEHPGIHVCTVCGGIYIRKREAV